MILRSAICWISFLLTVPQFHHGQVVVEIQHAAPCSESAPCSKDTEFCDLNVKRCFSCSFVCDIDRGLEQECSRHCPNYKPKPESTTEATSTKNLVTPTPSTDSLNAEKDLNQPPKSGFHHTFLSLFIVLTILLFVIVIFLIISLFYLIIKRKPNRCVHNQAKGGIFRNVVTVPNIYDCEETACHCNKNVAKLMSNSQSQTYGKQEEYIRLLEKGESSKSPGVLRVYENETASRHTSIQSSVTPSDGLLQQDNGAVVALNEALSNSNKSNESGISLSSQYANENVDSQVQSFVIHNNSSVGVPSVHSERRVSEGLLSNKVVPAENPTAVDNQNSSPQTQGSSRQTSVESVKPTKPYHQNRHIYEQLRKIPWVEGYYSEGHVIQIYVDLQNLTVDWAINQLMDQTGQLASKFEILHSAELN